MATRWLILAMASAGLAAEGSGNLLRNAAFQDDWLTLLPENKTLHWCYFADFYNRRDFNPDGWTCKGSWTWADADLPPGWRRMALKSPDAELVQRVNWVLVHDERKLVNLADAGSFPALQPQRSRFPLRLVRDLTLRVRVKGTGVQRGAGSIELALCPPGSLTLADPHGTAVPPTASVSVPLPEGTSYEWQWVEAKLPAAMWLGAARAAAAKTPKEAEESARDGLVLPGTASVAIRYKAPSGEIALDRAELTEPGPDSPNLLPSGGFEEAGPQGYPVGWDPPAKYTYRPPRNYYLFTTWHNSLFEDRGPVGGDPLVVHSGARSLKMILAAGDERFVASKPIALNQKEPRLVEVTAWVRTDRLCTLQIDAASDTGERLDGFSFVQKAPVSIGTDEWRLVRQVFRPRQPVRALRLLLCARGVNGYTLDDTGQQPQNNVVGTVWWDDVRLFEPESTAAELAERGVQPAPEAPPKAVLHLEDVDLGERMLGENRLSAALVNPGGRATVTLEWAFTSPSGKRSVFRSSPVDVPGDARSTAQIPYVLTETCPAYREYRGTLSLLGSGGQPVASTELWFATWTTPIGLELGALYLQPNQAQFVRVNLGLAAATMAKLSHVRLDVVRRGTGEVLRTQRVLATPAALAYQHWRIPHGLRGDFGKLLLADLDVSSLPVQPFDRPERNWLIRAAAMDWEDGAIASVDSPPFCRQAHDPPQPPALSVHIDSDNLLYLQEQPWMPWGAIYGHVPVYAGPAAPGKYRDLRDLPPWSIYEGFTSATYDRRHSDLNCLRYVAGSVTDPKTLEKRWQEDNLLCASAFVAPQPVFSLDELAAKAGGQEKLDAYLAFCKSAPMIVSVAPGIEEAFGTFHAASAEQLAGLGEVVRHLRERTGRPVMVGHGGGWNRFEFEKAPDFDLYDPETEPFFPANLHVDLAPLVAGKAKAIWLRPQMYEDVPYERWRFHTYVELMRGARGWQIAHGPGDASLFRGLHGEMEFMKPIAYSKDRGPEVTVEPWIEHWARRYRGKLYIVAATTRGIALGRWRGEPTGDEAAGKRARVTAASAERPGAHSIQYLPNARPWPAGTRLVQYVRLAPEKLPANLVLLVKLNGRWARAVMWGEGGLASLRKSPEMAYWFLHTFHTNAEGFLGWDTKLVDKALDYIPREAARQGALPAAGRWARLEARLGAIGAAEALLDGVGFLHEGGEVAWGRTLLLHPDREEVVWGDSVELPPDQLARVRIAVRGLRAGTPIRVVFEDREVTASDGHFTDDFRGQDLYQRYGGGFGRGYGDAPVALHVYEIPWP